MPEACSIFPETCEDCRGASYCSRKAIEAIKSLKNSETLPKPNTYIITGIFLKIEPANDLKDILRTQAYLEFKN